MNLVSLLLIKFKKKCQRVCFAFWAKKTKLPICRSRVKQSISNNRTERKMPGQFVVQKRNRHATQTETLNY